MTETNVIQLREPPLTEVEFEQHAYGISGATDAFRNALVRRGGLLLAIKNLNHIDALIDDLIDLKEEILEAAVDAAQ